MTNLYLTALKAILPYAENEARGLDALKGSPEAEAEADRAWKAVESAHAAIAEAAKAPIVTIDFDLGQQRQAVRQLLTACRMVVDRWEHGDLADAARTCQDAIAAAKVAGITPAPADIDVHALLAGRRQIAEIWSSLDVRSVRPELTDAQAWAVLERARQFYDASIGINWDVLACHAAAIAAAPPVVRPYSVLLLYPDNYLYDFGKTKTYYAFVAAADPLAAVAVAQHQAAAAQVVSIDDPTDFTPLLVTEGHHADKPLFNK